MKIFVSDFHPQMLKATEILSSDWLRVTLFHETVPWNEIIPSLAVDPSSVDHQIVLRKLDLSSLLTDHPEKK